MQKRTTLNIFIFHFHAHNNVWITHGLSFNLFISLKQNTVFQKRPFSKVCVVMYIAIKYMPRNVYFDKIIIFLRLLRPWQHTTLYGVYLFIEHPILLRKTNTTLFDTDQNSAVSLYFFDQVQHISGCTATEDGYRLEMPKAAQYLCFLNMKFQASRHLMCLNSPDCLRFVRNTENRFSHIAAHLSWLTTHIIWHTNMQLFYFCSHFCIF